jgi:hypothetical protein
MPTFTFKHRKIKNYRVGKFEFKNHLLVVRSEAERVEFIDIVSKFSRRISQDITELNEEAMRRLESDPFTQARKQSRVVLGAQGSSTIPSSAKGTGVMRPAALDQSGHVDPFDLSHPTGGGLEIDSPQGLDSAGEKDPLAGFDFLNKPVSPAQPTQ